MLTFLALLLMGVIILSIGRALYFEIDNGGDWVPLHFSALLIAVVITIAVLFTVNQDVTIEKSKVLVEPKIEIITEKVDTFILKSDTTYYYRFKK